MCFYRQPHSQHRFELSIQIVMNGLIKSPVLINMNDRSPSFNMDVCTQRLAPTGCCLNAIHGGAVYWNPQMNARNVKYRNLWGNIRTVEGAHTLRRDVMYGMLFGKWYVVLYVCEKEIGNVARMR